MRVLGEFHAQHLVNMAWSFVQLGHQPSVGWVERFRGEVVSRLQADARRYGLGGTSSSSSSMWGSPVQGGDNDGNTITLGTGVRGKLAATAAAAAGAAAAAAGAAAGGGTAATAAAAGDYPGEESLISSGGHPLLPSPPSPWRFNSQGLGVLAWAVAKQQWDMGEHFWPMLQQAAVKHVTRPVNGGLTSVDQGFTSQGLCLLLWGAAAAARRAVYEAEGAGGSSRVVVDEGFVGEVLKAMLARVLEEEERLEHGAEAQQQQQQQQQEEEEAVGSVRQRPRHQEQQQEWQADTNRQLLHDVVMSIWAVARLGSQPSAGLLQPLVDWSMGLVAKGLKGLQQQQQQLGREGQQGQQQQGQQQQQWQGVQQGLRRGLPTTSPSTSSSRVGRRGRKCGSATPVAGEDLNASNSAAAAAATSLRPAAAGISAVDGLLHYYSLVSGLLLWALGCTGFHPGTKTLREFYSCSAGCLLSFQARHLSRVVWGLVMLEEVPPKWWVERWWAAWVGRVRNGEVGVEEWMQVKAAAEIAWEIAQEGEEGGRGEDGEEQEKEQQQQRQERRQQQQRLWFVGLLRRGAAAARGSET